MEISELKTELKVASQSREARAALGSIIRRHIKELTLMTSDERAIWLTKLGMKASYGTEINKEIAIHKYDSRR